MNLVDACLTQVQRRVATGCPTPTYAKYEWSCISAFILQIARTLW
jgi:hypothetical protein